MTPITGRIPTDWIEYAPTGSWELLVGNGAIPPGSTGVLIQCPGMRWCLDPTVTGSATGLILGDNDTLRISDGADLLALMVKASVTLRMQFFTGPTGSLPAIIQPGAGGGGGGGGVQSVTGWQVDNTDPDNPVMIDPGPPVIPEIRSTVAIWVNQGVSPNGPPTPYDMGRSFPSINAALASYDYARGDVLVLLPGAHLIVPGTQLGNVRIHFLNASIGGSGSWSVKENSIVTLTGVGTIYQLRDVLGTIHSNGVNIVSDIIMPSGNLYLKGNFGTPDQPCSIVSYSTGVIEIHGEVHGGVIISLTTVRIFGDVHTYSIYPIELDECNVSFMGNIIDHYADISDRVLRFGRNCVISLRDIIVTTSMRACILANGADQSVIEINGHLITPFQYAIIENGGGDVTYNIRSSSLFNTDVGVIDGTNASPSSVMNICGAYSNRPIIFPGTVNGTLNVHPWVY